ncbi:MAG: hypothetical protein ACI8XZ_005296 [Gammaproteobacteria bacterium]
MRCNRPLWVNTVEKGGQSKLSEDDFSRLRSLTMSFISFEMVELVFMLLSAPSRWDDGEALSFF